MKGGWYFLTCQYNCHAIDQMSNVRKKNALKLFFPIQCDRTSVTEEKENNNTGLKPVSELQLKDFINTVPAAKLDHG